MIFVRISLRVQFLLFPLLLASCVTSPRIPHAKESALFETTGVAFHINARDREIRYVATLLAKTPIEAPFYLQILYENPADSTAPYSEYRVWLPGFPSIPLRSPPVEDLRIGAVYLVEIRIFDTPNIHAADPIDTHEIYYYSNIDTHSYSR